MAAIEQCRTEALGGQVYCLGYRSHPQHCSGFHAHPSQRILLRHSSDELCRTALRRWRMFGTLQRVQPVVKRGLQVARTVISRLTKPIAHGPVLGTVNDLARSKPQLVAENLLLRQQLVVLNRSVKRPHFTPADRGLIVLLASKLQTGCPQGEGGLAHSQAGDGATLASPGLPVVLETQIARSIAGTEDPSRDHQPDQGDGRQQSRVSSSSLASRLPSARFSVTCARRVHQDPTDRPGPRSSATTPTTCGPVTSFRSPMSSSAHCSLSSSPSSARAVLCMSASPDHLRIHGSRSN
jgi:hypothetical protein